MAENHLKGNCSELLLLYYIIDIMFNFLILLKMINYLGRYAAPKLHFLASCHFGGRDRENVTRGGSKGLNRDGTKNGLFHLISVPPPIDDKNLENTP